MGSSDEEGALLSVQEGVGGPRVYGMRWLYLAAYCLLTAANGGAFISFGPIDVTAAAFFHQSAIAVNLMSGIGKVARLPARGADLFIAFISVMLFH